LFIHAGIFVEQDIDHRTVGRPAAVAFRGNGRENLLHFLQRGDFPADRSEMRVGDRLDLGAAAWRSIGEPQQRPHFVLRKPEFARAADEDKPPVMIRAELAPAIRAAPCGWNHADPFEVADVFEMNAGQLRQFSRRVVSGSRFCDRHGWHSRLLL
jgi:hypothetical protein